METVITRELAAGIMKPLERPADAYKNKCGTVGAAAGSVGMAGAAVLCGRSALRAGCGLMQYYAPDGIRDILQISVPEATWFPRDADERILSCDAIAVGPGLGYHEEDRKFFEYIFSEYEKTIVLDADGLNDITRMDLSGMLAASKADVIITPHMGEAARLLDERRVEDRRRAVRELSEKYGVTAVLKGHETLISCLDGRNFRNCRTGNPGMATGGSGDVLTGVIASFAAQGLKPSDAAAAGVFIHGLSGDMAAEKTGENGMIAGDIAEALPSAIRSILGR